jgi:hydrogenase nickel incorporation protein HypB
MCTTCGCGNPDGPPGGHHHGDDGHDHQHPHDHGHTHDHEDETRRIAVEQAILAKNDAYAASNRVLLGERAILALNLVSSPGSGKTTLLLRTIEALRDEVEITVIEGDQQTSQDADRIRATGVPALQINTGKGCHLDAHQVGHALQELGPGENGILFVENVGNLVCPAPFDLGEAHKVVILSVTEGDDKPLKYPDMFAAADLMVVNKVDLLPYVEFNVARCVEYARRCNHAIEVLQLSATAGAGMDGWLAWLDRERRALLATHKAALQAKLSALDAELG